MWSSFKSRNIHVLIHALYCYNLVDIAFYIKVHLFCFSSFPSFLLNIFGVYITNTCCGCAISHINWETTKRSLSKTTSTKTLLNSEFCVSSLVSFPGSFQGFSVTEKSLHGNEATSYYCILWSHMVIPVLWETVVHISLIAYCRTLLLLPKKCFSKLVYIPLLLIVPYNNFQCFYKTKFFHSNGTLQF